MTAIDLEDCSEQTRMNVDFAKYVDGLVPAVVQDSVTKTVLMVGFMNEEALERTKLSGNVTFFSRSRKRIWVKGESSRNYLRAVAIHADCDNDTLLIKAIPTGSVCHRGSDTCFNEENPNENFLIELEKIINQRKTDPKGDSYTSQLFDQGLNRIAQKVGEEAVEMIIAAMNNDEVTFKDEAADLLFHFLVLLRAKGVALDIILSALASRRQGKRDSKIHP